MRPFESDPVRVLWVEGSPKGEQSLSSACARRVVEVASDATPCDVVHLDVWTSDLPEFGRDAALAKFAPLLGDELTPEQTALWARVGAAIADLATFDVVLVSTPMWNWSIPYRLKQWFDVVCQPGRTFTLDAQGRHVGVLGVGKIAQLIVARSSAYDGRSPEMADFQQPYLEYLLGGMFGYTLGDTLVLEPTTRFTPEEREAVWVEAVERAAATGERLGRLIAERRAGANAAGPAS
ncbi:MAG: NAD(P)H-dependent oxidoreductase [Ilumatobacteraceae bacterium]